MYNKLILENKSKAFKVKFNGTEYNVPQGKFEAEQILGNFLAAKAKIWGLDVSVKGQPEPRTVTGITEDTKEETKEDTKEDEVDESKNETKKKKSTK